MALNRKAQLTMFIILGVVLVILIGILIYSGTRTREAQKEVKMKETAEFPSELQPVGVFVQACLEQEAEKTINITAIQGGRPLAPRHPYNWENMTLSHGYYMGLNELPTREEMQLEMAGHLKLKLNDCINNLKVFKNKGMNLEYGDFEPKFMVTPDVVIVDMDFPITLKKETGEVKIEKFSAEIPSRLGYLHEAAYKIVEMETKHESTTSLIINELKVWMMIYPQAEADNVVMIDRVKIEKPFFYYVNSYGFNENPTIWDVHMVFGTVGEKISFYVNATDPDGGTLTYSDNTDLFDIDPKTGLIEFVPQQSNSYFPIIRVEDDRKGYDEVAVPIHVVKKK